MRAIRGTPPGPPAGIGLEVVIKSIPSVLTFARWLLFTDRDLFERNIARYNPGLPCRWIENISEVTNDPVLFVRDLKGRTSSMEWGQLSQAAGSRALAYLEAASTEALSGKIASIVTAPAAKEAMGGSFVGQRDSPAERAGVPQYAMAFFAPTFKVVLATIHVSLREALAQVSIDHYGR